MCMRLAGQWALNLECKMAWCWYHLLDLQLDISLACFLDWNFAINLTHVKYLWLEFQLA